MAKTPSGGFRVGNVSYGRFSGVRPGSAANQNVTEAARIREAVEKAAKTKPDTSGLRINSGKYAYEKPAASALGRAAGKVAGAVARTAGRLAGPVGALVSMTQPAGEGSDRPSGPLMSGPKKSGPVGGSLSAPARSEPSRSGGTSNSRGPGGPSGPNSGPSRSGGSSGSMGPSGPSGPNSGPSRSGGTSASSGPAGPSGPNSGPSRSSSPSSGPGGPSGPNSGPSRSASAPKGTERFAKGSLVMSKASKKSYFSRDAVKHTRGMYNSKPSRGKK